MQGLPRCWLLGLGRAAWATRHVVDAPDGPSARPAWGNVAALSAAVLLLALGARWLRAKALAEGAGGAQEGRPPEEEPLDARLRRSFSQMEQELVKQVTLVRELKAELSLRHGGCAVPECQRGRRGSGSGSSSSGLRAFNLVVYDVAEEG